MSARRVGAAVVLDPDASGIGILTERDILNSVGAGQNPDRRPPTTHTTTDVVFAAPAWTLEEAADAMAHGGFRHLIVLDDDEPVGIVSVRDIIRCWAPPRSGPRRTRLNRERLRRPGHAEEAGAPGTGLSVIRQATIEQPPRRATTSARAAGGTSRRSWRSLAAKGYAQPRRAWTAASSRLP